MIEQWKLIEGSNYYEVSNFGNVRSIDHITIQKDRFGNLKPNHYKGKELKKIKCSEGYLCVKINNKKRLIHRLVAQAFITNEWSYWCDKVNHIDGNKTNNCVLNLEWCDASYNTKHAYKNGLIIPNKTEKQKEQVYNWNRKGIEFNKSKQKFIKCIETGEIFNNTRDCCSKLNINRRSLMRHLKGQLVLGKYKVNSVGGFTFEYVT